MTTRRAARPALAAAVLHHGFITRSCSRTRAGLGPAVGWRHYPPDARDGGMTGGSMTSPGTAEEPVASNGGDPAPAVPVLSASARAR
ncbi:MAG: hypothetical protein ACRDNS_00985, partial [Trebonia sp.]